MATQSTALEAVKQILSKQGSRLDKCWAIVPFVDVRELSVDERAAILRYLREHEGDPPSSEERLEYTDCAPAEWQKLCSQVDPLVDRACNSSYHSDVYSEKALVRELRSASRAQYTAGLYRWLEVQRYKQ